jgi:hypothetical protein
MDQGTPASINTTDHLSVAIDTIIESLRENEWESVTRIETPLGVHGVTYGVEYEVRDTEQYATIGMVLGGSAPGPEVYVEIEDGTYGVMQGFRIYREDVMA